MKNKIEKIINNSFDNETREQKKLRQSLSRFDYNKQLLFDRKDLLGALAKWAIKQNPYDYPYSYPKNFPEVLISFHDNIQMYYEKLPSNNLGYLKMNLEQLENFIEGNLMPILEFKLWNERANGREGMGFISRMDIGNEKDPDDDFICLDALIRNIAHEIYDSQIA